MSMYDLVQINKLNKSAVTIVRHVKTLKQVKEIADFNFSEIYIRKISKGFFSRWRYMPFKSYEFYRSRIVNNDANAFLSKLFLSKNQV